MILRYQISIIKWLETNNCDCTFQLLPKSKWVFKLNYFVLHFRPISIMRYNRFDVYCSLLKTKEVSNIQGFSNIRGKKEATSWSVINKEKTITSVRAFRKCFLIVFDYVLIHFIKSIHEITDMLVKVCFFSCSRILSFTNTGF